MFNKFLRFLVITARCDRYNHDEAGDDDDDDLSSTTNEDWDESVSSKDDNEFRTSVMKRFDSCNRKYSLVSVVAIYKYVWCCCLDCNILLFKL